VFFSSLSLSHFNFFQCFTTAADNSVFWGNSCSEGNYLPVDAKQFRKIIGSCENLQSLRHKHLKRMALCYLVGEYQDQNSSPVFPDGGLLHSLAADEELMNAMIATAKISI
jgi:hypothetical protein